MDIYHTIAYWVPIMRVILYFLQLLQKYSKIDIITPIL